MDGNWIIVTGYLLYILFFIVSGVYGIYLFYKRYIVKDVDDNFEKRKN